MTEEMRARVAVSGLAAVLAAFLGIQSVQREADSSSDITGFEQRLEAAFQPRLLFSPEGSGSESFGTERLQDLDGRYLEFQFDRTPSPNDVDIIRDQTVSGLPFSKPPPGLSGKLGKVTQLDPGWHQVERLWAGLSLSNQEIAKAKALVRLSSKPRDVDEGSWENRFATSERPWQIEERTWRLAKTVWVGAGGAVAAFLAVFIAIAILAWLWAFLLRRIRELSNAVRGKE